MSIEEKIIDAIVDKVVKSSLLLVWGFLLFCEGSLILFMIYGSRKKRINKVFKIKIIGKLMPLIVGMACSIIVFIFQNYKTIIKSEMTIELMKTNMLSSILLSFAIVGAISIIVLPIRERKRLKGDNRNNGN